MAIDRRKFNEKSFVDHIPMELFTEFLAPYRGSLNGLDPDNLSAKHLYDYLTSAKDSYPVQMLEALHKMNDVRSQDNYDRIIDLGKEKGVLPKILNGSDSPPLAELIMRSFLYAKTEVFDLLWDEEFLHSLDLPYDRLASVAVPIKVTTVKLEAFRKAVRKQCKDNLQGDLCEIKHYPDEDGEYFVIRHGWHYERITVDEKGTEKVIGIRPIKPDIIHYNPESGKLQMKTTTQKAEDQDELRDLFAKHILGDEELFDHDEADNLYSLSPLKRDGVDFEISEGLQAGDSAKIVEVKVSSGEGSKRTITMVNNKRDALAVIAAKYSNLDLTKDEVLSAKISFRLIRNDRVIRKMVEIKPPCTCKFRQNTFADTIWDLLDRNGFMLKRQD